VLSSLQDEHPVLRRPTAFISHSTDDSEQLAPVVAYLQQLGFQRWMNEVQGGEDIAATVCEAAWEADAFVLALSPAALESPWVEIETGTALQRWVETRKERPQILPITLAPVEVPVHLKRLNYIDVGALSEADWKSRIRTWAEQHFGDRLRPDAAPPPRGTTGRRRALLVALDAYGDSRPGRLLAPTSDLEDLRAVLADPAIGRWDVARVLNAATPEVERAIKELFDEAGEDDLVMLCVSGHSVLDATGTLYFPTSSTQPDALASSAIADRFVADRMRSTRARATVLILDCRHTRRAPTAGAARESADIAERFTVNMAPVAARDGVTHGRVVIAASTELEQTFEATGAGALTPAPAGSPFTRALVQGLRSGDADADSDGCVTPEELYAYASQRMRETAPQQTPGIFSRLYGQLTIAWSPQPAPDPLPPPTTTSRPPVPSEPPTPEVAPGRELARFEHGGAVRGVAFSPDGKLLVSCGDDRHWRQWDMAEERELRCQAHPLSVWPSRELLSVAYGPDGRYVASAGCDHTARVWDLSAGGELFHITHRGWVRDVTFSPDGALVASVGDDRCARIWSISERRKLYTVKATKPLHAVAFSPDSTRLAIAGAEGAAQVLALQGEGESWSASHPAAVWDVRFSRDGRFLVTAGADGCARIWDLDERPSPREPVRVVRHTFAVWAVALRPDGARVATGGDDGSARIWNVANGRELVTCGHPGPVWQVAFSPDGTRLATACDDRTVRVWAV
jgi:TIR domain/WD domain, G-beta repeat